MNHTNTMKGNQENVKKKNMSIKLVGGGAGGGGLAGIILLGGALALVTTFAFKRKLKSKPEKNKQQDSSNKSIEKVDHKLVVGEGLSFLVPDSLSPHLNDHSSSNVTEDTQDKFSTQILLDESSETNVGNDEEMDIPEKGRNNEFCDESTINREEFPVPVADISLPLKLGEVNKMNDSFEEVEVREDNKESPTIDCNQVGDSYNDWQVVLRIDGNGETNDDQELVKAALTDDQLGLGGKTHEKGKASYGSGETITERKEILVEGDQFNQPGTDDDSQKLANEHDENGEIFIKKRKEPIDAAVRDQTRLDQMGGEECDNDAEIINEKGEELMGEVVAANGMILSEELKATTMNGDQDIYCSDGILFIRNETACNSNKPELLLQLIDSSSVTKPGDNDLSEERLVVEDTKILKEDEANKPAIQEDHGKVKDREQTQLAGANGDNKEYYNTSSENTKGKFEEADGISVENDQQKQSWEDCQKIHVNGDQEINAFESNSYEVQEFSFLPLDSPSLVKHGKLQKHDFPETTQHVEVINPMEKDGLSEEVFSYQIMLENKTSVQSAENDKMQIHDDGGGSAAAKGEETLKKSYVDTAQPTKLIEEEDNNDDSKEEEAVEIIQRENFEVENNLQMTQEDHDSNDSIDKEEHDNDFDDGDVEDESDEEDIDNDTEEEDNVEEVEENSETTGDSSLDSNTEAIWPDEPVFEFSEKVNDMQANNLNFKEIVEKDSYVKFNSHKLEDDDGDSFTMAYSEKLLPDTTTLEHPTNMFNLKFWFLSLLVPFLLLLWLSWSQQSYFTSFHYHLE